MDPTETPLGFLRWDEAGRERLAALSGAEWSDLLVAVERSAGVPLLARRIRRAGINPPAAIAARLRGHTFAVAGKTLQARGVLAEALAATGRPMLLLKGIDLGDRLYGNAGHRQMGDVDFLVHGEDAMAYHAHLVDRGFTASGIPDAGMRAAEWHHHVIYAPPGPGQLPFELHWRLADGALGNAIDMAEIWSRSLPHPTLPQGARVMAAEDLFVYLCLHLQQHLFEVPATSLWDIAELLDCPALPLDWPVIWARAHAWGLTEGVQATLNLVTRLLGVPTQDFSNDAPDPTLLALLPQGPASLGQYPAFMTVADARLGKALAGGLGWRTRLDALWNGLLPPRLEVRTRYGRPDQSNWADLRSYARRLVAISRGKLPLLFAWASDRGGTRRSIDRINRLRRHLDQRR